MRLKVGVSLVLLGVLLGVALGEADLASRALNAAKEQFSELLPPQVEEQPEGVDVEAELQASFHLPLPEGRIVHPGEIGSHGLPWFKHWFGDKVSSFHTVDLEGRSDVKALALELSVYEDTFRARDFAFAVRIGYKDADWLVEKVTHTAADLSKIAEDVGDPNGFWRVVLRIPIDPSRRLVYVVLQTEGDSFYSLRVANAELILR